ncbi:MAG: hypothetical protein MZV70_22430 [Desulfobacterales bacterium]|nr:hypothetical protein [Desulfobacterales bacterium]
MREFLESLRELEAESERMPLDQGSRIVILSDLHLGDGSGSDDFLRNRAAVQDALRSWYLPREYLLVLNGDIEDLQKASFPRILGAHEGILPAAGRLRLPGAHCGRSSGTTTSACSCARISGTPYSMPSGWSGAAGPCWYTTATRPPSSS